VKSEEVNFQSQNVVESNANILILFRLK